MAFTVEGTGETKVFIVGLSMGPIVSKPQKIKFLSGVSYAIFIATFDIDYEDDDKSDESSQNGSVKINELDVKEFLPTRPLHQSSSLASNVNLAAMCMASSPSANELSMGIWGNPQLMVVQPVETNRSHSNSNDFDLSYVEDLEGIPAPPMVRDSPKLPPSRSNSKSAFQHAVSQTVGQAQVMLKPVVSEQNLMVKGSPDHSTLQRIVSDNENNYVAASASAVVETACGIAFHKKEAEFQPTSIGCASEDTTAALSSISSATMANTSVMYSISEHGKLSATIAADDTIKITEKISGNSLMVSLPPTWEPTADFAFPVVHLPILRVLDEIDYKRFKDVTHFADGSNSNIYLAKLNGEQVVIKMIKEEVLTNEVAIHEFDLEHGMLSRISHPNIIRMIGAGRYPRRFLVLQYLGGRTLHTILQQHQTNQTGLAQKLFCKPSFTYSTLLERAKDIAKAMDYLHCGCYPGATIIHRDLKPENIGFTKDGHLVLFDFGLVTCVKTRKRATDVYEMTGYTGSLRYMAPEVAARKPYTEKVDVYSFGIMLWQMARDRMPFANLHKREDFMARVVEGGERPKLDKSWPAGFSSLLVKCWHVDAMQRPAFSRIIVELDQLILENMQNGTPYGANKWGSFKKNLVRSNSDAAAATTPKRK